jgi:hypothetical protein
MRIDRDRARADGLTDQEIAFVEAYLDKHGTNRRAAFVVLGTSPQWVCETVAEALDQLRPGCWLRQVTEEAHKTLTAELHLPIFKQGDDLAEHLREEKDTKAALLAYAERLRGAAGMVEALAKNAEYLEIEQADTLFILVSGPGLVIHSLIEEGVLVLEPDSEEAEED